MVFLAIDKEQIIVAIVFKFNLGFWWMQIDTMNFVDHKLVHIDNYDEH